MPYVRAVGSRLRRLLAVVFGLFALLVVNSVYLVAVSVTQRITGQTWEMGLSNTDVGANCGISFSPSDELLLQSRRRFRKQVRCVNGVRAVQFLPQVALYPRQIVLQDPGVVVTGRERVQRS